MIRQNEEWHLKHVKESKYLLQIRKCDDLSCCSVKRSSLFRVIKDGFIPPPIPIQQTKNGLQYSDQSVSSSPIELEIESKSEEYISLFQNLTIGSAMLPQIAHQAFPLEIPFDYSCPTMKSKLNETTCVTSGRYFASKSSFDSYSQSINQEQNVNLIKPEKLLVRRGDEILCCIKNSLNLEEYIWQRCDELDLSEVNLEGVTETNLISGIKVYTEYERTALWKNL